MAKEIAKIEDQMPALTKEDVRKFFCDKATEKEVGMFLQIAKLNNLNPFNREIYIVKYGAYPASILTGYEVYLKRAESSGNYAGFKVWTEGKVPDMIAKIEVYRKDWERPLVHEVEYSEYVQKSGSGQPTKFWRDKTKTMLKKVAISQGMRFAFPGELGGLPYTRDEIHTEGSGREYEVVQESPTMTVPEMPSISNQDAVTGPNLDESTTADQIPFGGPDSSNSASGVPDYADKKISAAQRKRLFAIARDGKYTQDEVKSYLKEIHSLESTQDITKGQQYELICNYFGKK